MWQRKELRIQMFFPAQWSSLIGNLIHETVYFNFRYGIVCVHFALLKHDLSFWPLAQALWKCVVSAERFLRELYGSAEDSDVISCAI